MFQVEIEIPVKYHYRAEIDNKRPYVYTVMDSLDASSLPVTLLPYPKELIT